MSDWHDVENNLAFPPRENITSNNLTDKWKAGKLNHGWYWVKTVYGFVKPVYYLITRAKGELVKGFAEEPEDRVEEVLARCDYDHFVELTQKVERLRDENDDLKRKNSDLLALISEGNTVINNLRQLFEEQEEELKTLKMLELPIASDDVLSECRDLLDSKNKELESAHWYQTIQNEDIAKLRQLLKECQKVLSYYGNSNLPCDCSSNIHYDNQTALNLLTRINEVIK
jgi:hypothetical protein